MLCSILIPTRNRFEECCRAVRSCFSSVPAKANPDFEILIRVDDDDPKLDMYKSYERTASDWVKLVVGPRGKGYANLNGYYQDLVNVARGEWQWMFNDDAIILGPWYEQLSRIVEEKVLVFPQFHGLNLSNYENDGHGAFPCFRKNCWKHWDQTVIPEGCNIDSWLWQMAGRSGFKTQFLQGVKVQHNRRTTEELIREHTL